MNTSSDKEQLLQAEKQRLEEEIKALGIPPDMGDEPGFQDESEESEEFYNQQSQAIALKQRLADVESELLALSNDRPTDINQE